MTILIVVLIGLMVLTFLAYVLLGLWSGVTIDKWDFDAWVGAILQSVLFPIGWLVMIYVYLRYKESE